MGAGAGFGSADAAGTPAARCGGGHAADHGFERDEEISRGRHIQIVLVVSERDEAADGVEVLEQISLRGVAGWPPGSASCAGAAVSVGRGWGGYPASRSSPSRLCSRSWPAFAGSRPCAVLHEHGQVVEQVAAASAGCGASRRECLPAHERASRASTWWTQIPRCRRLASPSDRRRIPSAARASR